MMNMDYIKTAEELGWPITTRPSGGLHHSIGDCLNERLDICESAECVFRLVLAVHPSDRHAQYSYVQFPVKK